MVGQTLGHYKILDKLGAGGMGEVYRAEDTTLDREVALKILPPELADSQERLDRFQREAKTLAALDHPNIVHIHTVEEADGVHFLTMQLVEGQPLSQLIPKAGMPLDRIFEIAIPLADALATAHEKGVIHRDLKPANIMVTDEGRVKVLDFGLAKLRQETQATLATELPTEPLTEEGRIVGTMPYMSPEQLEGKEIDARSDIFSLGVVLFEMATGERPFNGDSPASLISSILTIIPRPVDEVREDIPHHLSRIIRRCLEKDPARRYQSALDVRNEVEDLKTESASGEMWQKATPARRHARHWAGLAAAGIVLVAALAVVFWVLRSDRETVQGGSVTRSATFTKLVFDTAQKGKVSTSPEGRFFTYASDASGNWDIYLQRIAGGQAINLTEDCLDDDRQPAFSPDGEWIAFRSERNGGGIFVMGATGESVRRITDRGFFPDWAADGSKIVFSTYGGQGPWVGAAEERIWTVVLAIGDLEMVLDRSALMPAWSPSGSRLAYYGVWEPAETKSKWDLFTVSADGGAPVPVTDDIYFEEAPAWSPDGKSLYYISNRSGTRDLWRVRIDETTGETLGNPEAMTSGSGVSYVSPAGDGDRILYSSRQRSFELLRVPFNPAAERVVGPLASITPPGLQARHPSISPDGEWVAFDGDFGNPSKKAIGIIRTDGSGLRRLTDAAYRDRYPRWSPDGSRLAFFSTRSGSPQAWIINSDGSGLRLLTDAPGTEVSPPFWSPDGSRLVASSRDDKVTYLFHPDRPWSEKAPTELLRFDDGGDRFFATSWSPDGERLTGTLFKGATSSRGILASYSLDTGSFQLLTEELQAEVWWPVWLKDGRRLLFTAESDDDRVIVLIDSETGDYQEVISSESLSIAPDKLAWSIAVSPDNRSVFLERIHQDTDIWLLTLGEQG